jgi:hypothetical protein
VTQFEAAVARLVDQGVPRDLAEVVAGTERGNWAPDVIGRPSDGGRPEVNRRLGLRS